MIKSIIAFILSLLTMISPLSVSLNNGKETNNLTSSSEEYSLNATNDFASSIADEIEKNKNIDTACNICDISIDKEIANVEICAENSCEVDVKICDENNNLITEEKADVEKGTDSVELNLDSEIPEYYIIKASVIDDETGIKSEYENYDNTKWYKEFESKEIEDYNPDLVLNLDENTNTNFAIFDAKTVFISTDYKCVTETKSDETSIYKFYGDVENLTLKIGDVFCYNKSDIENMLLGKIIEVSYSKEYIEVITQKITIEDAFQIVKIDFNSETNSINTEEILTTTSTNLPTTTLTYKNDLYKFSSKLKGSVSGSLEIGFKIDYDKSKGYIKVTLSATPSIKFSVSFSVDYLNKEWLISASTVPTGIIGLSIDFKSYFYIKGAIKGTFNSTIKKKFSWSYSNKSGLSNTSSAFEFSGDIKVEASIEFGIKPYLSISFIHLVSVGYSNSLGLKISASQKYTLWSNSSKKHDCKHCIDGDISIEYGQSARIEVIWKKYEVALPGSISIKIGDFYWSITNGEFGWGECPYNSYLTTIKVVDQSGNSIKNAKVDGSSVGSNGTIQKWYSSGCHEICVSANGYISVQQKVGISSSKSYTIILERGNSSSIKKVTDSSYGNYKKISSSKSVKSSYKTTSTGSGTKSTYIGSTKYVAPLTYTEPSGKYTLSTAMASQRRSDVAWVQRALKNLGYSLKVDGYFGNETAGIVKKFQQDYEISVTGKVNNETLQLIKNPVKKVSAPKLKLTSNSQLESGGIVSVSWDAVQYADSYRVYVYNSKGKLMNSAIDTKSTNAAFVLYEPETYTIKATAKNSRGVSSESTLDTKITVHGKPLVTFVDWDGTVLCRQFIDYGASAVAPASPERDGYTFSKWVGTYTNVTDNVTITAQYTKNQYNVIFYLDKDGKQSVKTKCYFGEKAEAPTDDKISIQLGYKFIGWDKDISNITEDTVVKPVYKWENENLPVIIDNYTVTKDDGYGYNFNVSIRNYDVARTNGRVVVALKTKDNRFITMTESAAFTLGKSASDTVEIFVPCSENVSTAEIYVVNSYNNLIPISASSTYNLNESSSSTGVTRNINGKVSADYAGKQAILFIYKINDAADYTNEYVGQTVIGSDGSYNFDYCLREEPSFTSGDYTVVLGIEGLDNIIYLDEIEAPKPTYTVTFKDFYGNVIKTEEVLQGEHATLPDENPEIAGYTFAGWDYTNSSIYEDTTITAIYVHKIYTVIFIDWTNERFDAQTYYYNEPLRTPDLSTLDDYNAIGWENVAEGMPVTENMVITAKYEKKSFTVNFYDYDGNIIDTQIVEYGQSATAPELDEDLYNFYGWDNDNFDCVTSSLDIKPYFSYTQDTKTPYANISSGVYNDTINVTLNCDDEDSIIYYSIDGGEFAEYTTPLTITKSSQLEFYATSFGKNDSLSLNEYYAINRTGDEANWMIPVNVYKGTDVVNETFVKYGSKISESDLFTEEYGYNFIGFSLNEDLSDILSDDYIITSPLKLYVKDEAKNFTVVFKDADGNVLDTQTVKYLESATAPDVTVEQEGLIFTGWDTDDFICVTDNLEVYAVVIDENSIVGVNLSRNTYSMMEGYTYTLTADVTGETDAELFWSSSDENVATVDENGKITALSDGFVVITASLLGTDISSDCYITIEKNKDMSLTLIDNSKYTEYDNYICGVSPSDNLVSTVKNQINTSLVKFFNDDTELKDTDTVSTGTIVKMYDTDGNIIDSNIIIVVGDVDSNSFTNNKDASLISQYIVGKRNFDEIALLAGDVNGDGEVNNKDASMIMRYLVNKEKI